MTSRDFCYWLQGYFELQTAGAPLAALTPAQVDMVQRHLALVFKHEIDPSYGGDQTELQTIHDGPKPPKWPKVNIGGIDDHTGGLIRC